MEIIEATTGNTGIAFAMVATRRGYAFTGLHPATISAEMKAMLASFGARLVLTEAKDFVGRCH
jgi:cysteine synthase A